MRNDDGDDGLDDLRAVAGMLGAKIEPMSSPGGPIDVGALLKSGRWAYKDLPWLPEAVFDALVDAAGEGNVHVLATSTRGGMRRGQVLLSDEGRAGVTARQEDLADMFDAARSGKLHPSPPGRN